MATEFLDTVYRVLGEAKLKSSFLSVGGAADALEDKLQGINGALGAVGLGAGLVGLNLFSSKIATLGADAAESENLIKVSFGGMADSASAWGENLQSTLGISALEAQRQAATFNVMFNSMKLGEQKSYDLATSLTELAYDISSLAFCLARKPSSNMLTLTASPKAANSLLNSKKFWPATA
jgi:hypothetical protein